ncbi:hypothetical protein GIB67_017429 [Kingdonia uniflora]|uniref:Uncharacterized protein n=1 Tax=Kingdonia uniflora TaxID=39325 RepID=A0A7J7M4B5_9MAGN|nr:hypothetical protein GIB67_017429 [Kingdonia uniflora]
MSMAPVEVTTPLRVTGLEIVVYKPPIEMISPPLVSDGESCKKIVPQMSLRERLQSWGDDMHACFVGNSLHGGKSRIGNSGPKRKKSDVSDEAAQFQQISESLFFMVVEVSAATVLSRLELGTDPYLVVPINFMMKKKGWKSIIPLRLRGKSTTRFCLFPKLRSAGLGPGNTPVYLNVYDLTPMNGYVYWAGVGIFHSGVEGNSTYLFSFFLAY